LPRRGRRETSEMETEKKDAGMGGEVLPPPSEDDEMDDGDEGGWSQPLNLDGLDYMKKLPKDFQPGGRQAAQIHKEDVKEWQESALLQIHRNSSQGPADGALKGYVDDFDDDSDRKAPDHHSNFARKPPPNTDVWVGEEEAFGITGSHTPDINGIYEPNEASFGEWPRWRNSRTGVYMWYGSNGIWHMTEEAEDLAHRNGPERCKIWYVAKGAEFCPPKTGWYDRLKPDKGLVLAVHRREDDPNYHNVAGVSYHRESLLPPSVQSAEYKKKVAQEELDFGGGLEGIAAMQAAEDAEMAEP